jgi:CRISPR system Cascade subunit CasD
MPEILTFRLYAPLAAMGGVAVGEQRDGWMRPGRSALLGLIGACLGLDRANEDAQMALATFYRLGMLVLSSGPTLIDYHTAQMPSARRGVRYATRADELADRRTLNTVLTRRAYRPDLLALVAVVADEGPRWPLAAIAAAMRTPVFTPYLGRKSCPLGLPLAPAVTEAVRLAAALAARAADPEEAALHNRLLPRRPHGDPVLAVPPQDAGTGERLRTERRRDWPRSRRRWQFDLREEAVLRWPLEPPCS